MKQRCRIIPGLHTMRAYMVLLCVATAAEGLHAQSAWQLTPYVARVWLAVEDRPDLPLSWRKDLPPQLDAQIQTVFRAVWDGTVEQAPAGIRHRMLNWFEHVTPEELFHAAPNADTWDKLFLVAITARLGGFRVQLREFDCRVSHLGPIEESDVELVAVVPNRVVRLMAHGFSPVVRIDRAADRTARTFLRAGGLIRSENTPAVVRKGDVLLPFERRTSNTGASGPEDVRTIDWTYLRVDKRVGSSVECDVITGFYQPLRSKRSRRVQQLAIRARRVSDRSTLRLQTRQIPAEPLIGYAIHEKTGPDATELLGHTDWRGEMVIPSSDDPIRILYLKSGNHVAAKLPLVPGIKDIVVASLVDDRQRVAAERFLDGIKTALIDLVARRESLAARIRRRIQEGEFEEAEKLIDEFRRLPTQADFQRQIQQRQQALAVSDAQLRRRIDTLFVDTYRVLGRYLDAGRLDQLTAALASARSSP